MLSKYLTSIAVVAASFMYSPVVQASTSVYTCPEFGVTSVSTGIVVNKKFVNAAFCFTGALSIDGTLKVTGESVDAAKNDGLCTIAKIGYTRNNKFSEIVFPANCNGGRISITSSLVRGVTNANISMCMVDQVKRVASMCTSKNSFLPGPKPIYAPGINRR